MEKKLNLSERVRSDISALAKRCDIDRVILFGSRARGDNRERSDIDLAVTGGKTNLFAVDIDDYVHTLLMFDVVNLDGDVQPELRSEIKRDGVVIYEKA